MGGRVTAHRGYVMDQWYELFMKGPEEKVLPGKPEAEIIYIPERIIIPEKEEEAAFYAAYGISTEKQFNPCVIKEVRQDGFTIRELTIGELERLQEYIKKEYGV